MNEVPWLRSGVGQTPSDGGCIMQVVDWIHRKEWTDSPPCVHPVIRSLAIKLNDTLDDKGRQKLLDLAPRLMGTNTGGKELSVRLALFCAESVLHVWTSNYPEDDRPQKAIEAVGAWIETPSSAYAAAASAAYAAAHATAAAANANAAYASAAYAAAHAAASAAYAAAASAAYAAAASAAYANAAIAAAAIAEAASFDLLVGLLDEYDRITGRTLIEELDYTEVCSVMAAR